MKHSVAAATECFTSPTPMGLARARRFISHLTRGVLPIRKNHARGLLAHLARVLLRALVATLLLWLAIALPLPPLNSRLWLMIRVPVAVFVFIIYIGMLLYDTFFFDRYQN